MNKFISFKLCVIFCGFLLLAIPSLVVFADVIQDRQDKFKLSKKSMRALRNAIKIEDLPRALDAVSFHVDWSVKLPLYFPPESAASMTNDSDASGDIWEDFERFRRMNLDYMDSSSAVNSALDARNFKLASKNFKKLAKACKGCHESFRN